MLEKYREVQGLTEEQIRMADREIINLVTKIQSAVSGKYYHIHCNIPVEMYPFYTRPVYMYPIFIDDYGMRWSARHLLSREDIKKIEINVLKTHPPQKN